MNITIRKAEVKDALCIIEAEREIAKTPGYFCSQPAELDEKAVVQTIQAPQSIYLVAEHQGEIIGHAFLEPYILQSLRHIADLNIAVHLGWQNKGIGRQLLEQLIERAKNSSVIEKIQLNVRASNIPAISLYKKMGFQEEGRLKKRIKVKDRYIDDLIMGLELKKNEACMKVNLESISERNGINFLSPTDKKIYSVGISTGGLAEVKMAQSVRGRHIIATTVDLTGAEYAKQFIRESGLSDRIEIKIEDVSQPLPYPNYHFDYIYARLVLHYLAKDALTSALAELYRVLRAEGKMFIVVRSVDCLEASDRAAKFDVLTGLTTYSSEGKSYSRCFHSQESIKEYLSLAGFTIKQMDAYQERLCVDFQRTKPSSQIDSLIEVVAVK